MNTEKREHAYSELLDLLQIPKTERQSYVEYLERHYLRPAAAPKKGNKLFEKANRHARLLTSAIMEMNAEEIGLVTQGMRERYAGGDLFVVHPDGDNTYAHLVFVLSVLVTALDYCVGRDPDREPDDQTYERNWQLNAAIRDLKVLSETLGSPPLEDLGMKDHRSKKLARVFSLLHELFPDVIPRRIPASSIRDVFNPRSRKGVRNQ
jgi:hypothetical protein